MDFLATKILLIVVLFVVSAVSSSLPFFLLSRARHTRHQARWHLAICLLNSFSGGVFIAACLLDLIPEAREEMEKVLTVADVDIEYPITELLVSGGFFLVLFIEQLVEFCHHAGGTSQTCEEHSHNTEQLSAGYQRYDETGRAEDTTDTLASIPVSGSLSLRSILLILALSVHSVFDGLAIGIQDTYSQLYAIYIAVLVHKTVLAFTLGMDIAQSRPSLRASLVTVGIFCLSSPLGAAVGIAVSSLPESLPQLLAEGVLQCLSAGTFLYVTFIEILPEQLKVSQVPSPAKLVAITLGFALMVGLIAI